jgi:predicted ATPase
MHFYKNRKVNDSICIIEDNWDDFGYRTLFQVSFVDTNGNEHRLGSLSIGYAGQGKGHTIIPSEFVSLPDNYFTLGDKDYYEAIKDRGDAFRKEVLSALNDMAYNTDIYLKYSSQPVVYTSFFRFITPADLLRKFKPLAEGKAIPTPFHYSYKISNPDGSECEMEFNVDPESIPATNIHAIIGKNGAGKTHCLRGIYKSFAESNPSLAMKLKMDDENNAINKAIFVTFSAFDSGDLIGDDNDRCKFIGLKKKVSGMTVNKTDEDLNGDYYEAIIDCCKSGKLFLWIDIMRDLDNSQTFQDVAILPHIIDNGSMSVSEIEKSPIPLASSSKEYFSKCSSGHKIVLLTLAQLIAYADEKTLVLMDEPEMHLHPPLMALFIDLISKLLNVINGFAIVATHSPVILQEIPSSCVYVMERRDGGAKVTKPTIATYGENISLITRKVFEHELQETGHYKKLRDIGNGNKRYEQALEEFTSDIGDEAKSILRMFIYEREKREKNR